MKKLNVLIVGLIFLCLINPATAGTAGDGSHPGPIEGDCGATWNGSLINYMVDWLESCVGLIIIGMAG